MFVLFLRIWKNRWSRRLQPETSDTIVNVKTYKDFMLPRYYIFYLFCYFIYFLWYLILHNILLPLYTYIYTYYYRNISFVCLLVAVSLIRFQWLTEDPEKPFHIPNHLSYRFYKIVYRSNYSLLILIGNGITSISIFSFYPRSFIV